MIQESKLRIVIDSRGAEKTAQRVRQELQGITTHGEYATKSMDAVSVGIRQLVGQMAGVVTVGAAISKMDAYTGMQNRLKLVTDSQAELNTAMNDTFAIAQKTASSWDSVAMVYQRFADNADRLGISMKQTAALTETVSKAISVSGGSAASAEAALMQFGQALASGVLRGEEFNSIAEQAPGLLKAIAMGMDTNVGSLRAMAAEGKITGDELVKALSKAKPYIDDLFNKTDFTIAQSFTQLSNEVTKFVGAAGAGSGAAAGLSAAISGLANNLSTIANIAVIGGVALLTKTILAQTVAIQGSITASVARRAADAAVLQSQVQLAALEVQRTRQIAAQAISEIGLARQELNSATTRTARAAATVRLTQAEIAHRIALNQTTAAIATNTAAQNALNASRAIGTRMLALVGGPIGALTIGVTALAAGYMYLKSRTAEANAKLEEQGKIAQETDAELRKLSGNDKISAVRDLTAAFNAQNETLAKSKESVDAVLFSIRAVSVENEAARKVTEDARNGVISYDEAIKRLNQMDIPTDLYDQLKKQVFQYNENAEKAGESQRALSALGKVVKLAGNLFQNAAVQVAKNTDELNKNDTAAEKAAKAQAKFKKSLFDREFNASLTKAMLAQGYNAEQINLISEYALKLQKEGKSITVEQVQYLLKINSIEEQNKKVIESRNAAEKKVTQEKEKQLKLGQRLIGISGNSGIGTGAHLDVRYGGSRDGQKVSKEHLARLEAGGKSLSNYRVSSDYGNRKAPTKGASSFHKGIDFAMPVGTPITTKVAVKDIKTAYDSKGGGYYSTVTFEDGVVLKLLHQSPSMMGEVKGGASDGTLKSHQDIERQAEQQANSQLQLQMAVATERKRIETQLQKDIEEINKAGFSPEETKRLTAEYQARADNDIAIAEYALKTKLDDYESFRKTESQLLEDSFNERKFYASRDLELTKEQRDKAVALLDEQLKQEQALMKLAYETRLFQLRENLMSETAAIQERYRLEREQILLNSKLSQEQKQREIALSKALQEEENRKRLNSAVQQWGGIQAEMNGTGDQYSLEQQRFSRYDASQQVFDTQIGQVEQAAQDPNANMEELAAQREAIWQAHHDRMTAIESDYQASSYSLQLGYGQQVTGALSGMFGAMLGESSSAYRALYAAQQAFALAQAGMNVWKSASDAYANEPGTWYQKAIAAAAATLQSGTFVSLIQAATPKGFAEGGFTGYGGKYEPAGIVHKWEGVLTKEEMMAIGGPQGFEGLRKSIKNGSYANGGVAGINAARDTHRVGMGAVNAINSGGSGGKAVIQPKVVINNYSSEKVETSTNQDGELMVTIGKILDQKIDSGVDRGIQRNLRQGYPLANAIKGR
ncbi:MULTISPECIES: tape measure protein [unclassified Acinetobacter]|uniref:tape measure protein n=1 Tax=unclassified Acinetobacter TaxID=196816 RepID=UPI0015D27595|nr:MULTISPECIES: tape measure protein [unclassified Acinetobacter]